MRIAFLGTPAFAVPTLAALRESGHDIAAVYTRAPKPAGRRGLDLTRSPVHVFADDQGLPVFCPKSLRDQAATDAFAGLDVALAVVVGYGLILPPAILALPRHGCLNLHPSLLPRWRGAAPIQRPIMAGDTETAAAIMKMEEGLDTGPIGLEERMPIPPEATASDMHDRLATTGARLMVDALARIESGVLAFRPQAEAGILYAAKIDKAEARIDWSRSAREIHNQVRGLSPFPGAYVETDLGKGRERLKILRTRLIEAEGEAGTTLDDALTIACGSGAVRLVDMQRAGKPQMTAEAFLRGTPIPKGFRL